MATLYELSNAIDILSDALDSADTEQEMEIAFLTLETLDMQFDEKVDNCTKLIKNEESDISVLKSEVDRLQRRIKTKENKINWIKENLLYSFKRTGKTKFKTPLFNCSVCKTAKPIILKVDESEIPDKYFKVEKRLNKAMLNDDFKKGCEDYCKYGEPTEYLRITGQKVKE